MKNYYQILKVDSSATLKEIKKAYRSLSLKLHPDVNSSNSAAEEFSQVSEAYGVLKDAVRRRKYDLLLAYKKAGRKKTSWEQAVNKGAQKGRKRGYRYAEKPIEESKRKWKWDFTSGFFELILEFIVNLIVG